MGNVPIRRRNQATIRLFRVGDNDINLESLGEYSFGIAEGHEVQHYMPPQFPLVPVITKARVELCLKTWEMIQAASVDKMKQYGRPGIVLFYDEFFYRLFERDTTFSTVFVNVKQRGEVLIKALTFILSMRAEKPEDIISMKNRCRFLGFKHRTYSKVRPHHFAAYTMTCVEVIMYWLGEEATPVVGDAWSNIVGFVLRYILEPYLYRRTDPYESYQNTTIAAVREITESAARSAVSQRDSRNSSRKGLAVIRSALERRPSSKMNQSNT